jgi:hypothetical protein
MQGYYQIGKLPKKTKKCRRREGRKKKIILGKRINMKIIIIIKIIIKIIIIIIINLMK